MPAAIRVAFTRPSDTDAYTIGDLVANSTVAADVVPLQWTTSKLLGQGRIERVRLYKSDPTATNAKFDLHLFSASPGVPTNGDNGAFGIATSVAHIGTVACDMSTGGLAGTAGLSKQFAITGGIVFDLTATAGERRLFGLLIAAAAYTPASDEVFAATLEITNGM